MGLEPKSNREKHLQNRGVRMSKNHSFVKAGKTLAKTLRYIVVKTVQFSYYDKIEELAFQVDLVCEKF